MHTHLYTPLKQNKKNGKTGAPRDSTADGVTDTIMNRAKLSAAAMHMSTTMACTDSRLRSIRLAC